MARTLLAAVAVAVAAGAVAQATDAQTPILRAASANHRHVVVTVSVGDLQPTELLVAKRRAVNAEGAFLRKNLRLQEAIHVPSSATGVVRWKSRGTLAPGTYFVQVMAVATGGITDCPRSQRNCNERWSNAHRVVVRMSS
jgi:hypothetical protein